MNIYYVEDIRKPFEGAKEVEAESAIKAVKKVFSNEKVTRDYTNTGDILVRAPYMTRYGKAYRTYVYALGDTVIWSCHVKR